ncbi:MAG: glucosamine-6-phosphate deaminase [Paludibacteraceae bacterium]|nr:glucosamine-6-phosphate deaminase [Paludibacteraceae bacterium]
MNTYSPKDVFEQSRVAQLEQLPVTLYETPQAGALAVARHIADEIRDRQAKGQKFVVSLAPGRSTSDVYAELVRMYREEGLSFKNVEFFDLYEYYPLADDRLGNHAQLSRQLLDLVDIPKENIHNIPGNMPKEDILSFCREYEWQIAQAGGIDFQLLGIGRCGNIAFNQPGSSFISSTRLVVLDNNSREDAKIMFGSVDQVPVSAVTMGIDTILQAREVMIIAWGEHKSGIVRKAVEGEYNVSCPASALQHHKHTAVLLDISAAAALTRMATPWVVRSCEWDDRLIRRAVVWLCRQTDKPILKLTNKDYNDYGLSELITRFESAYNCNIKVFNDLQHTITGWPGGKPNADDTNRPERAIPFPKDILIFSPHPDDDVISMGGTFARLIKQGHNVHVAYETSGCIAVCDDEVIRFLDFVRGYADLGLLQGGDAYHKYEEYMHFLKDEKIGDQDTREILDLKALIRRGEATAACRYMGLETDHIHFLNLPFYETGSIHKAPLGDADISIVRKILEEIRPYEMFVAGDLADPHGTHRVCWEAVLAAISQLRETDAWQEWLSECRIWMYRGAWQEWDIDQIEMAVPISPEELRFKRNTILKHQSQMESAPFMGNDERLFWQRAEDRNHATAEIYARLGLANYEAIEAFVRYKME